VILIIVSLFTRPTSLKRLDGFFAKIHTPVQQTPEKDREVVQANQANPGQWNSQKLIGGVNWEILRPARIDYWGFLGTWVLVGLVLFLLYGIFTFL
jgi:SSS family solute:Na+ symporter